MAKDNNTKVFGAQKYYPTTMGVDSLQTPPDQRSAAQQQYAGTDINNISEISPKFKNVVFDRPNAFVDAAAAYANNLEMVVSFYHVPSGQAVYFKAFITAFNETYSCDWGREAVFGRIDPIYLFKQTDRRISLALAVPAATDSEGYENLGRVQMLSQFLYPSYTDIESATSIAQSPLVKIKVMNLLQSTRSTATKADTNPFDIINEYKSANAAEDGQLGVINSLAINHNLERPDAGVIERGPNTILPKHIEINIEFSPIHEAPLGWKDGRTQNNRFPYNVALFSGETERDQQGNALITAATPPPDGSPEEAEFGGWGPGSGEPGPGDSAYKPPQDTNRGTTEQATAIKHQSMGMGSAGASDGAPRNSRSLSRLIQEQTAHLGPLNIERNKRGKFKIRRSRNKIVDLED